MSKNSRVMFRKRCQQAGYPMKVTAVRFTNGRRELQTDGQKWWSETSLMPYEEWKAEYER